MSKKEGGLTRAGVPRDPFSLLREVTSQLDRAFTESRWPSFQWPAFRSPSVASAAAWFPEIDVFEKDNRLVTKIDLPGVKKEDVKVEVTEGHLAISGERKSEVEEKKSDFYRCERDYGSFYRAVPLPEGVELDDVKATFADGVLEVSVPLPAKPDSRTRSVQIQDAQGATKAA